MPKIKKLLKENRSFIIFILLMSVFRSAVADYNSVPTTSMLPTIIPGDQIIINKLAYDIKVPFINYSLMRLDEPKRGDIIVFESAAAELRLVKRVIGLPGDSIALIDNQLLINGQRVQYDTNVTETSALQVTEHLPGLSHAIQFTDALTDQYGSFATQEVPDGHFLVLGDNRQHSADSRMIGFVPRDEILGRAEKVLVSFNYDKHYQPRSGRFLSPLI